VPLTDEEARLLKAAFYRGPAFLIEEEGYNAEGIRTFFERDDVRALAGQLKSEYDLHDLLKARAKFAARRGLHALIDPALAVLTLAIGGPEYVRDKKTHNVMRDSRGHPLLVNPEPTNIQMDAVKQVLAGAGLADFRIVTDPGADNTVERLFRKVEDEPRVLDTDPLGMTPAERTLALERVRVAIDRLAAHLPEARETFRREFEKKLNGSRRRAVKKTAVRKKAKKRSARRGKG
jgi:hypothetical protein